MMNDKAGEFDLAPFNEPSWDTHPDVLCSVPETTNAVDLSDRTFLYLAAIAESATATDLSDRTLLYLAAITEAANAVDTVSALRILAAALVESATAEDVQSCIANFLAAIAEGATAIDVQSCAGIFLASILESATAEDIQNRTLLLVAALIEAANAVDVQESYYFFLVIPPFMHKDLIDPYGTMGAWLWLAEIVVPTQTTQRIARNTADVIYGGITFSKSNFDPPGRIPLTGDGSIPRIQLRVAQDGTGTLENIVNATKGGVNGTVKLIRTCEKYFEMPVAELERTYDILTAGSDPTWVTFTLGIPNPLTQRIPLWSYSSKVCPLATPSLFKGPRCQYAGEDTVCTGLIGDCRTKGNAVHWGAEIGLDPNAVRI